MKSLSIILTTLAVISLGGCVKSHYTVGKKDAVTLFVRLPLAKKVQFASSIDNFTLHPARKQTGWLWRVEVPTTKEFTYFYLVDGSTYLPKCRYKEADDFGNENCIYQTNM